MALIKCKDCGHDMSDRASACPNCGCPSPISSERAVREAIARARSVVDQTEKEYKEMMKKLDNPGGLPYFFPGW